MCGSITVSVLLWLTCLSNMLSHPCSLHRERQAVLEVLQCVRAEEGKDSTQVVIIEGEGGMGKSTLISDVLSTLADVHKLEVLFGGGDGHDNKVFTSALLCSPSLRRNRPRTIPIDPSSSK